MKYSIRTRKLRSKTIICLITVALLALASCSQPKPAAKSNAVPIRVRTLPQRDTSFENMTAKGELSAAFYGQNQSASFKMQIARTDSLAMTVSGPLGITLGKLYAKPHFFAFYNVFMNEAYTGTPTEENLRSALSLPVAYADFVRLMRAETPFAPDKYIRFVQSELVYFKYKDSTFQDVVFLNTDSTISSYHRRAPDGNTQMSVFFLDYQYTNGKMFPHRIAISFPPISSEVKIEFDDVKFNEYFEKPFSFGIPSSVKTRSID